MGLSMTQIAEFLQSLFYAFDEYLIFTFTIMLTFSIVMGIKRLITWGS